MNSCLRYLLRSLGSAMILYTVLGRIIYGGVYWGKLKYWNDGNSAADHLWLIALLQWIFGLCLPLGSLIVNCMIIHSTRSSNCNPIHLKFPEELYPFIQRKYPNFPSEKYFEERCSTPRKFFISFLVCECVAPIIVIIVRCHIKKKDDSLSENE